MRILLRTAVGLALAPFLVFGQGFVQEHVHPADADHPHATMHRHVESHHGAHDLDHASPGEHASLIDSDDDHDDAIWLNAAVIGRTNFKIYVPVALNEAKADPPTLVLSWSGLPYDDACPTHGPPHSPHTLRGPPSFPA